MKISYGKNVYGLKEINAVLSKLKNQLKWVFLLTFLKERLENCFQKSLV